MVSIFGVWLVNCTKPQLRKPNPIAKLGPNLLEANMAMHQIHMKEVVATKC